jgi:hypothetical protein
LSVDEDVDGVELVVVDLSEDDLSEDDFSVVDFSEVDEAAAVAEADLLSERLSVR